MELLDGRDNYEVDRAAGDAAVAVYPDITRMASEARRFLIRAVRFLAEDAGLRQFLDVGTGLPTMQNTHEVAQSVAPDSKVVYVDHDPLVIAMAETLLTSVSGEGEAGYVEADFNRPEAVLEAARARLDFHEPVGVMFMGSLGHAPSDGDMLRIVRTVMDAVPSGSHLALYDGTTDDVGYVTLCEEYAKTGGLPYHPRPQGVLRQASEGLEMVEPGFVPITQWRPDGGTPEPIGAYCAVARKP
ncbi:SAM-dependent methyltransferase [Actinomadura adrarensis]|uniref:SAM-dependent methyltransferase n=1 Tax=Actinomadura adrarensis TaxID=1819600 RepID=A0ABW3CAW7_9ACTN